MNYLLRSTHISGRAVVVIAALAGVTLAPLRAQISGQVYDASSNAPVAGLPMMAVSIPASPSLQPVVIPVTSGADGTFSVAAPPGNYLLCAEEDKGYLDPCQWSTPSSPIAAPSSAPLAMALRRGIRFAVLLSDPNGALAGLANSAQLAGVVSPPLTATITDSAGTVRLMPFSRSAGSLYEFSTFVPENAQFTLAVTSTYISLGDEAGNGLAGNLYQAALTIPSIASLSAGIPAWLPFWLSSRSGPRSKTVGFQVNGLLAQ